MTRVDDRSGFDVPTRLRLVESDLDKLDARLDHMDARLGKIMAACLAILTSLVVASVMLVLNLAADST